MAGYIGSKASVVSSGAERKKTFAITTTTTVLSGLSYTPTFVHLFHNGVRLVDGTDYTATDGTSITLTSGAESGDEVVVISYATFQAADAYTKAEADSEFVSVAGDTMTGGLTVGGPFTSLGIDDNAAATAMKIDSSGNVLVGTTDNTPYNNSGTGNGGSALHADGLFSAARDGNAVGIFNRLSSDGDIVEFRKDGLTKVGSIGASGTISYIVLGPCGLRGNTTTNSLLPANSSGSASDNAVDLGRYDFRFDDVYATNGTIQTSDRNEKQDIEVLSDAEQRVAQACKGLLRKFRWQDAVAEKGDDARIHFGIIAQDLQDAFTAQGLDAGRYAMFISSTWWEATETYTDDDGVEQTRTDTYETQAEAPEGATERTRLGVRYPELLAFIIGAM